MIDELFAAVCSLRPGVELTMVGDDIEGITYLTPNVVPVTRAQVEAEVARLATLKTEAEAEAQVAADAKEAARVAAVAHAQSLGFTDEMIAAMGLGGVNA